MTDGEQLTNELLALSAAWGQTIRIAAVPNGDPDHCLRIRRVRDRSALPVMLVDETDARPFVRCVETTDSDAIRVSVR